MNTGRIMAKTGNAQPNLQFKVTAFMSGDLVVSEIGWLMNLNEFPLDGARCLFPLAKSLLRYIREKTRP